MSEFMKHLPPYYRKSKVMKSVLDALETEYARLKAETQLTENQFFVLLSDRSISNHEQDVGISPDNASDLDARRGRILSRMRGTGTVTKSMLMNVAGSFINGEVEVIEYADRYTFAIKFISKKGVPINLDDIKAVIEDVKPAHLAVEYIFTYRTWLEVQNTLSNWEEAKQNTWDWLRSFDIVKNITITDVGLVFFCPDENGNASVRVENGKPIAYLVI